MDTDARTLALLKARDPDQLRRIADKHTGRLYRAARGMGIRSGEAEDVVQDVFVTFLSSLDRYEGRGAVGTWLFGILIRKVQERRRTHRRDDLHDQVDETWEGLFDADGRWVRPPADPVVTLEGRELARAIQECLDDLAPQQREVLVLRQFRDLSAAAVSKVLDLTVTHVGVLLHRARVRMRTCLDTRGWRTTT